MSTQQTASYQCSGVRAVKDGAGPWQGSMSVTIPGLQRAGAKAKLLIFTTQSHEDCLESVAAMHWESDDGAVVYQGDELFRSLGKTPTPSCTSDAVFAEMHRLQEQLPELVKSLQTYYRKV